MKQTNFLLCISTVLCSLEADAFSVFQTNTLQRNSIQYTTALKSSEEGEPDAKLILGEEAAKALGELGSEEGWLAAAKERTVSAKEKYLEEIRLEEEAAEKKRQAKKEALEKGEEVNYSAGDMGEYVDFEEDGFDAAKGNDAEGGWGESTAPEGEPEEEPELFLFGDEEKGGDDNGGLIL